jgi:lysophospholipase L1-like esterase
MTSHRNAASLLLALSLVAGCHSDDSLNAPKVIDPMFRRYAALGNSITAGFQSLGINDSTQRRSYAALLAAGMGTGFTFPALPRPGCPPPFTNNVTQARVGGAAAPPCSGNAVPNELLNNLGVPGNAVGTLLSNFGGSPSAFDPLKTFMLGGRTEIEAMQRLKPTFVSIEIGDNDVLGAFISLTNAGDSTQITPLPQFIAQFDSVADSVAATGAKVAVVSVANVTLIPFASPAGIYYCLKNADPVCTTVVNPPIPQNPILGALPTFTVAASCGPLAGGFSFQVPWPIALGKVQAAIGGTPTSIDCTDQPSVIGPEETAAMQTAVTAYNNHIQSVAQARGWAYFDINPAFAQLKATGQVPVFPDVSGAFMNPPQSITFGPIFSLDGIHPSTIGQRMIADSLASVINQTYSTSLPVPVCGTVSCPLP